MKTIYYGRITLFLSAVLLVFLFSCSSNKNFVRNYSGIDEDKSYDLVAVPGVPFTLKGWSKTMKARVYWSKYLYDKGIAKNIMYSGSSVASPYYEGKIMAMYAIAIGIPANHVFYEIKAEHGTENVYYAYHKAKKMGFNHIAIATDPFQARQLRRFTRVKLSSDVAIIPIIFDTLKAMRPYMVDPAIDYNQAYNKDFVPLSSRENIWKRQLGTWGKNIDHDAY
jgi:uncharacterized SAM-binding protein YcdF (DUF218 family)